MEFDRVITRTPTGWAEWERSNVAVTDEGIALFERPVLELATVGVDAVDVSRGESHALFALQSTGRLSRYTPDDGPVDTVPLRVTNPTDVPSALVVTTETVVLVTEAGVTAYARRGFEPRWAVDIGFESVTAAVGVDEHVFVLDRLSKRVFSVDARGVRASTSNLVDPADIATDGDGVLYVLDETGDGAVVRQFREGHSGDDGFTETTGSDADGTWPRRVVYADGTTPPRVSALSVLADQTVVVSTTTNAGAGVVVREVPGTARFEAFAGTTPSLRRLSLTGSVEDGVSGYGVTDDGAVCTVTQSSEYRRNPESGRYDGTADMQFDASVEAIQWHRIRLTTTGPLAQTAVRVEYFATDERIGALDRVEGLNETAVERLRDGGIDDIWTLCRWSLTDVAAAVDTTEETVREWRDTARAFLDDRWAAHGVSLETPTPTDALLVDAVGRFLHVRLRLVGSRHASPRVSAFEAYLPYRSYVRYLPDQYRTATPSGSFLDRFLAMFETGFSDIEAEIDAMGRFIDADAVPANDLDWLGGWLGVEADETWSTSKKRALLRRAPHVAERRGTRAGLFELLELYLEPEPGSPLPALCEAVELDGVDDAETRARYERAFGDNDVHVLIEKTDERRLRGVENIVKRGTPAHAAVDVVPLEPRLRLDSHTYLGWNSQLPNREFVLDRSVLGQNTVVATSRDR